MTQIKRPQNLVIPSDEKELSCPNTSNTSATASASQMFTAVQHDHLVSRALAR